MSYREERFESQQAWRHAERGIISRPQELPHIAAELNKQVQKVFDTYIDDKRIPPIVAWSVRVDRPKKPHLYYWEARTPDDIDEELIAPFEQGMHILTEYATNYATRYFLEKSLDVPFVNQALSGYGKIMDEISYASFHKDTYGLMQQVEDVAKKNGLDYQDALFTALFKHNFSDLNYLIHLAGIEGCEDVTDLAIVLGKNPRDKSLLTKLDASMQIQELDSEAVKQFKTSVRSLWLAGLTRTPGVVEVCLGNSTFIAAEAAIATLRMDPGRLQSALAIGAIAFVGSSSFVVFSAIHEAIHEYSASEDYFGFQPVTLRKTDRKE